MPEDPDEEGAPEEDDMPDDADEEGDAEAL